MKAHNGMRPHDIVVLLKIISIDSKWLNKDLSRVLKISSSEISESLNRSMLSGLLSSDKRKVMKSAFLNFLQFGLRYVFPAVPGPIAKGLPTSHSAPALKDHFISSETYVWPYRFGDSRGQAISPLYPQQIEAVLNDEKLYEMLTLVDALRLGRPRECEKAIELLKKLFEKAHA